MANDALQASFGLDIAPLVQSLKRATEAVKEASGKIGKEGFGEILKPLAAIGASVATIDGVFEGLNGGLELGAQMQDVSNQTGLAVESVYEFRRAFRDSGVEIEKIGPLINKMQKYLVDAASTKGGNAMLQSLGLDAASLASAKPEEAFRKIGEAINRLPNFAERARASITVFGKSGGELLKVFQSPAFANLGNVSETARLLGENAAVFKEAGESLSHIGEKISGFFVGIESETVPALMGVVHAFEKLDLATSGKNVGSVIGTFGEALAEGRLGELLWLDFKVAIEKTVNFLAAGLYSLTAGLLDISGFVGQYFLDILKISTSRDFWMGMLDTLGSFASTFNAMLLNGLADLIDQMKGIPLIGDKIHGGAEAIRESAQGWTDAATSQGNRAGSEFTSAGGGLGSDVSGQFDYMANQLLTKFKSIDLFGSSDSDALEAVTDSLYAGLDQANKEAREEARKSQVNGSFNAADLGRGQNAFADSLRKIGGGGFAGGQVILSWMRTNARPDFCKRSPTA